MVRFATNPLRRTAFVAAALAALAVPAAHAATSCTNVACGGCTPPSGATSTLIPGASFPAGMTTPIVFVDPGDFRGRRLVATQQGGILVWNTQTSSFLATPWLDLRDDVGGPVNNGGSERGLLAMAADPDYVTNGRLYVYYTGSDGDVTIARYTRSAVDADTGSLGSALVILRIDHPVSNHNGGWMAFGPGGFLYITIGDGGGGCDDVNGNTSFDDPGELDAQRSNTLLGKMLRIDVRGIDPAGLPPDDCGVGPNNYSVPASNPFAGQEPACDEVWGMGLRNPFRFSFDRLTGDIYIGDVGQNKWEEINLKRADVPAPVNFGWVCREGDETGANNESNCPLANLTPFCPTDAGTAAQFPRTISGFWDPILCHHNGSWVSIMGGYRYRGTMVPSVTGSYFYSDAACGDIWKTTTLDPANPAAITSSCWASGFGGGYGFAEDHLGELYVVVGGAGRVDCIHNGAGCTWSNTDLFADGTETGTLARWNGGST
jgi:hypothetical protein